jgi:hypothetical protein
MLSDLAEAFAAGRLFTTAEFTTKWFCGGGGDLTGR